MKILYLSYETSQIEYLDNTLFHGLKTIFATDMYENCDADIMYTDMSADARQSVFGNYKRFSLYGNLDRQLQNLIKSGEIEQLISEKFFDLIIYGSSFRTKPHLDLVLKTYERDRIIFANGEDEHSRIDGDLTTKGLYFKREIPSDVSNYYPVFPISFGIPGIKIVDSIPKKTKDLATVIPGQLDTYVFNTEEDYYKDYQQSKYAFTYKKGGWDCLRHYEILANGCLPAFPGIEHCPTNTMVNFPKEVILKTNTLIQQNKFSEEMYQETVQFLLNYTREKLTTEAIAYMMLKTVV